MNDFFSELESFIDEETKDASERVARANGYLSALLKISEFIRDYKEEHDEQ